jgi:hypothetical protein
MKRIALFIIPLLIFSSALRAQQHTKLSDAIQKGLIRLNIVASGHGGRCASVEAQNTGTQVLDLDIDCGQKIVNSDSSQQNLMVTQKESIHLLPNAKATRKVYAMCINAGKGSPSNKPFRLGQLAQGALMRLAQLIEQKGWQNSNAQSAVWSITDNRSINSIGSDVSDDYEMVNTLRGFVAKEKKITNYTRSAKKVRVEKNVEGTVDVIIDQKSNVSVYLVSSDDKVVKYLAQDSKNPGIVRVNYYLKNLDYSAGTYYIVVKVNNAERKREVVNLE